VQVDSTKLVHAGLLCVKSVGLHPRVVNFRSTVLTL
jgi:hypothetical protein